MIELPGFKNMDLLLSKYFSLPWEGHRLQFRFEAFNLTNTAHLGSPGGNNQLRGSNPNDTDGATIFRADSPRIIQFALKYTF